MSQNLKNSTQWYRASVEEGSKTGRAIGFPTLNLDNVSILSGFEQGVYSVFVNIEGSIYGGALYYGPRLVMKENNLVIEIFVFDFNKEIYGMEIAFQPHSYIRPVMNFAELDELKKQLEKDCKDAKATLHQES